MLLVIELLVAAVVGYWLLIVAFILRGAFGVAWEESGHSRSGTAVRCVGIMLPFILVFGSIALT